MSQVENLAPQVVQRLMQEIRELVKTPPDGIQYIENEENTVSEVHAVIEGPEGTPFVGGRFRMKLVLSHDYPAQPPRGFFLTKIYHPNVASNGDICVNTLKKDWTSETTLRHVLQVIRCLLIVPFPESSLNDEAGKLFMDSYEEFARRARISTEVHAVCDEDDEDGAAAASSSRPKKLAGGGASTSSSSSSSSSASSSSSSGSGKCAAGDDEGTETDGAAVATSILGESALGRTNVGSGSSGSSSKKVADAKKKSLKRL